MAVSLVSTGVTFPDNTTQTTAATGFGFKNRIINGAMVIDQRNAGASVTAVDGTYTLDRWLTSTSQSGKYSVQQTPSASETGYSVRVAGGFTNYLAVTSLSSYSAVSSDYFGISQYIEGYNIADLGWGTSSAKTITLSFLVYSSLTGTFGGSLRNSANSRSYPFTYSISTANTWTPVSVTITGDTTGTWLTTNGKGISVWFDIGSGSTYKGTANAWASANYVAPTGTVSVVGTNGATFYITGVQLEKGSTATSFDYRPYGTELALCQRYYSTAGAIRTVGASSSTAGIILQISIPVTLRGTPSFSGSVSQVRAYNATSISIASATYSVSGTYDNSVYIQVGSLSVTDNTVYWATLNPSSLSAEL
jgi:hypothetical protein